MQLFQPAEKSSIGAVQYSRGYLDKESHLIKNSKSHNSFMDKDREREARVNPLRVYRTVCSAMCFGQEGLNEAWKVIFANNQARI